MISQDVQNYLKTIGQKGGKARAKNMAPKARSSQARMAVTSRWIKKRFGAELFANLGIPGAEIVDAGLKDIATGNLASVNALVVAEGRPRLRFLGVPVPDLPKSLCNIRNQLFGILSEEHGDMAYPRFCALLERINSFCDALAATYPIPKDSPHKHRRWHA